VSSIQYEFPVGVELVSWGSSKFGIMWQ